MSEAIIVAVITAAATIITVVIQNRATQAKIMAELDKHQAVTDTKVDELTREVREHNNFAKRVPVVEEQIKNLERRVSDLEE